MRQYGCLKAIPLSFFSRQLYRDVVANWSGGVLLYLLLLLCICWLFSSIQMQKVINIGYAEFSNEIVPQIPVMTIKNGELKTPENRPYFIKVKNPKTKDAEVLTIIDTSGQYQYLESSGAAVLVTPKTIYYRDRHDVKSLDFSSDFSMTVVPEILQQKIKHFIDWLWLIIFPMMVVFSFIYRIVQAAIYALIGKLFAVIFEIPLTYGEIFKISIFALTPAIILNTALDFVSLPFLHAGTVFFVITLVYLFFGIYSTKSSAKSA